MNTEKWINVNTRRPTREDADDQGCVLAWHAGGLYGTTVAVIFVTKSFPEYTHWMRMPNGPNEEKG